MAAVSIHTPAELSDMYVQSIPNCIHFPHAHLMPRLVPDPTRTLQHRPSNYENHCPAYLDYN
jgi:hypothetical protein